jgi:hypothetical protein
MQGSDNKRNFYNMQLYRNALLYYKLLVDPFL